MHPCYHKMKKKKLNFYVSVHRMNTYLLDSVSQYHTMSSAGDSASKACPIASVMCQHRWQRSSIWAVVLHGGQTTPRQGPGCRAVTSLTQLRSTRIINELPTLSGVDHQPVKPLCGNLELFPGSWMLWASGEFEAWVKAKLPHHKATWELQLGTWQQEWQPLLALARDLPGGSNTYSAFLN